MENLDALLDSIAGAIIAGKASGNRWRLNLPRVGAEAETLGVEPADLDEGGQHFDGIMSRLVVLSMTLPTRQHAHKTAKELFGPKGTLAPDFLIRTRIWNR
jgi:hypothetical protein